MPNGKEFTPPKPAVVYNTPFRLSWRNVMLGAIIGALVIAVLAASFLLYNKYDQNPLPNNLFQKKSTPSAKTASPSATPATPSAQTE